MESFAGSRGLLAEQLWNMPDLASNPPLINGGPTGSSMPLAWAHAEYIKLVRSVSDGRVFDRLDIVANRYLVPHEPSSLEIWNFDRQLQTMQAGKRLRIPLKIAFSLRWSVDNWSTFTDTQSAETAVDIYYVDLPTNQNDAGSLVQFTFYWTDSQRWEGQNYSVRLSLR
jgi:glucoamylase